MEKEVSCFLSSKMAQWVKALATKPGDDNDFNQQNPHDRSKEPTAKSCPLTSISGPYHIDTHTHTHKYVSVKIIQEYINRCNKEVN